LCKELREKVVVVETTRFYGPEMSSVILMHRNVLFTSCLGGNAVASETLGEASAFEWLDR